MTLVNPVWLSDEFTLITWLKGCQMVFDVARANKDGTFTVVDVLLEVLN